MPEKNTFNVADAAMLNCRKLLFRLRDLCLHAILHLLSNCHTHGLKYKTIFNTATSAILNLRKLPFWWRDLYLHVILHLRSKFRFNRPLWSRDIAKKRSAIWRSTAILNLQNFDVWQTLVPGNEGCICLPNFIYIHGWDIEIKEFSKWLPSAIFSLPILQFWSCDLYLHVIPHFSSKFCINWPLWRPDIATKRFSIWRPSAISNCKISIFCQMFFLRMETCIAYKTRLKSDNSQPRCGDNAIFKMEADRHLEFSKIAVLVTWPVSACDSSFPIQISH